MNPPHQMQVAQSMQHSIADRCDFVLLQWLLVHFDDVGRRSDAILHHQPGGVLVQVAALVLDRVGMIELAQKADLLEDVLPLLHALLAQIRHLLDGDDLTREVAARIVNGAERPVPDFTQIIEDLVRVMFVEELGDFRVFEAARSRCWCHCHAYFLFSKVTFFLLSLMIVMNIFPFKLPELQHVLFTIFADAKQTNNAEEVSDKLREEKERKRLKFQFAALRFQ